MNYIDIFGSTKDKRDLAADVIQYCIKTLMPRIRSLDISVKLTKLEGADGFCMEGENNRTFELEIDKTLSYDDFVTCICHEMVHVKQHVRNELVDKGVLKKWKGEEHIFAYSTTDEYMELPWEKEAYELQETLLSSYTAYRNSTKYHAGVHTKGCTVFS